jgi:hypothetical protein
LLRAAVLKKQKALKILSDFQGSVGILVVMR